MYGLHYCIKQLINRPTNKQAEYTTKILNHNCDNNHADPSILNPTLDGAGRFWTFLGMMTREGFSNSSCTKMDSTINKLISSSPEIANRKEAS